MVQTSITNLGEGEELELSSHITIKNIGGELFRIYQGGGVERDPQPLDDDQKNAIEAAQDAIGTTIGGYEITDLNESHRRIYIRFEKRDESDGTEDRFSMPIEKYSEFVGESGEDDHMFRQEFVHGSEEYEDGPHGGR